MKYIIYLFFVVCSFAQQQNNSNIFSPENRLKFGDYLFRQHDYLRALNEYQACLQHTKNDTVKFRFAYSLERINRFSEARDNFRTLFFNSDFENEARIQYLRTFILEENYKLFDSELNETLNIPEKHLYELDLLRLYVKLFDEHPVIDADSLINKIKPDNRSVVQSFIQKKLNPDYKSPVLAGVLSALIPGLGKIYTGNISDGITSFIFTGALTWLAVDNFNAGHNTRAWIFSGLAAYFYAGNVYGSVSSAYIYNAEYKYQLKKEIKLYLNSQNYFLPEFKFIFN